MAFAEQHKLVLRKEREAHAANMAAQNAEMDSLRDLLHTYEISSQRKDEVCVLLLNESIHQFIYSTYSVIVQGNNNCNVRLYIRKL